MSAKFLRPATRLFVSARFPVARAVVPAVPRSTSATFRSFSISARRSGNGETDSSLSAAISAEHSYEAETAASLPEVPEFLDTFKSQRVWDIQDNPGADDVILTRKFGNESLKLTFQISDIDPAPETDPDATDASTGSSAEVESAEAEEIEPSSGVPVSLIISKPAHPNAMSVDMEANDEGLIITNVAMFERSVALQDGSEGDWVRRGKYLGPQFEHLDGGVQEAFQTYLAERGVDDSLAQFILSYAEHKEQRDYVGWLEQVKGFVDE